jgi:putative hydrolase of the HAD superfamily
MRAVLFDLDDTLLDYRGGVDPCWEAACAACCAPGVDVPAVVHAIARSRRWFWSDPERHRRERVDMLRAWQRLVEHALAGLGAADSGALPAGLARAIAHEFAARRREAMRLFPDAVECLEALRRRGPGLALVTNGDASQQRDKIERHGLARFFDVVVIEGEFGAGKPEEVVYRHALSALGAEPGDAWMVGDHLEWDVEAPQRLGLTGVWLDRSGGGLPIDAPVTPHRIIRSLEELSGLGALPDTGLPASRPAQLSESRLPIPSRVASSPVP